MKRHDALLLFALGLLPVLAGCKNPLARSQKPEEEDAKVAEIRTIGDVTTVAYDRIEVVGVGLIVGLNGTGGGAPPASAYRTMLEEDLKKRGQDVKGMIDSPNHAMVVVTGRIPPGSRKNDFVDVSIALPEGSRCSSLRGGYLLPCKLFSYDSTQRLNPGAGTNRGLKGYDMIQAQGPLIVGNLHRGSRADDEESLKSGVIWSGGKCLVEPPLMLTLNQDQQYSRVAARVADRINATFPSQIRGPVATAKSASLVMLAVPLNYRLNLEHYLRVVRAIPLDKTPMQESVYGKQLAEQLLDPSKCVAAAIRLEAMGEESVPILKSGLSSPSPLSRFAAAQSLAYLRKPTGAEELSRLTREHPALRNLSLTALASLDESACHIRLADLMREREPELRYGAFRARFTQDDRATDVSGVKLNEAFFVHQVARDSEPMIHYVTSKRPEIVMFGDMHLLVPPFRLAVGDEFTIVADKGDQHCTIRRFSVKGGQPVRQCSLEVMEVLKNLTDIGGTYPDAIDLLRKAEATGGLSCELKFDALPKPYDVQELTRFAKEDPTLRSVAVSKTGGVQ